MSDLPSSGRGLQVSDRHQNQNWNPYINLRSCCSSYLSLAKSSTIRLPSFLFASSVVPETARWTSSIAPVFPVSRVLENSRTAYQNNWPTIPRRDVCEGCLVRGWGKCCWLSARGFVGGIGSLTCLGIKLHVVHVLAEILAGAMDLYVPLHVNSSTRSVVLFRLGGLDEMAGLVGQSELSNMITCLERRDLFSSLSPFWVCIELFSIIERTMEVFSKSREPR